MSSKLSKFLNLVFILTLFCVISCKKAAKEDNFAIDLTAKYNNQTNSFKINEDGSCFTLIKEVYKPDKFYQFKFSDFEVDSIQRVLNKLELNKCDTINDLFDDGTQYICILQKGNIKKKIVSGSCKNYQEVDRLVNYIIKTYKEKQKKEILESLKIINPPQLNEIK